MSASDTMMDGAASKSNFRLGEELNKLLISLYHPVIKLMLGRAKCVMTDYSSSYNSLNGNRIGPEGADTLASSLQHCRELEQLK